jgi:hypothetical protein
LILTIPNFRFWLLAEVVNTPQKGLLSGVKRTSDLRHFAAVKNLEKTLADQLLKPLITNGQSPRAALAQDHSTPYIVRSCYVPFTDGGETVFKNKQITLSGAENIIMAAGYAGQIGVPLNRHITISWWTASVPGRERDAQLEVLQLASKWLNYHGVVPAYVWVIENGPLLRHHSHILIHVPDRLAQAFRKMMNRWVKRVGGDPHTGGAIKMTKDTHDRSNYHKSIRDLLRYMLKGAEPQVAQLLGIEADYEKAGIIAGKRCGTSQNLGPKARAMNVPMCA